MDSEREKASGGLVIRIKGAEYCVTDGGEEVRCTVRGKFRIGKREGDVLPVVGDRVVYRKATVHDSRGPCGLITGVEPRKSLFARGGFSGGKPRIFGANIDLVFLVHSVAQPQLNLRLVDRMIVAAECGGIRPVICVNKTDLAEDPSALEKAMAVYTGMGYEVVFSSVPDGKGIGRLRDAMAGAISIMAGPSGSGKTSILSAIEPDLDERVEEVSGKTGKGKHTTTHFELHPLSTGGYLGDTPGIREFGIWGVSRQDLDLYFRDFEPYRAGCRFVSCTHSHEPGCAVKSAVGEGNLSAGRYDSYLRILEDLPKRPEQ